MKPETWKQLDQLFHDALALPPDQCDAFLNVACAGDDALRHEVEALLSAHGKAGSFIENQPSKLRCALSQKVKLIRLWDR
jgi:hypothetical protein